MEQPNYLVFLCFGEEGFFYECAYALLSLNRLHTAEELAKWEVWIYTDNKQWFSRFGKLPIKLNFIDIDAATITKWSGSINYIYRSKIELLIDFAGRHEGNVLFADTDIVFTHRLDKVIKDIGHGHLYLQQYEAVIQSKYSPVLKRLNRWFHDKPALSPGGRQVYEMEAWNSGIVGFNTRHKALLPQVLAFCDAHYPPPKYRVHTMEQIAFSVIFQEVGPIKTGVHYTMHYWHLKEARLILEDFFTHFNERSWDELVHLSIMVHMYVVMMEKVHYLYYRSVKEWISNKQWTPPKANWEALMKQI